MLTGQETTGTTATESTTPPVTAASYLRTNEDRIYLVRCLLTTIQSGLCTTNPIDADTADCIGFMTGYADTILSEINLVSNG